MAGPRYVCNGKTMIRVQWQDHDTCAMARPRYVCNGKTTTRVQWQDHDTCVMASLTFGDAVDELQDVLGHFVAWGRLAANEDGACMHRAACLQAKAI